MKSLLKSSLAGLATLMLVGGVAFLPSATQASLILVEGQDLFDTGTSMTVTSFTSGDKVFSEFTCTANDFGTAANVSCGNISITPVPDDADLFGWDAILIFNGGPGTSADLKITYKVERIDGAELITDAHLSFAGLSLGGDGTLFIGENFWSDAVKGSEPILCGGSACNLSVQNPIGVITADLFFDELQTTVFVLKDIQGSSKTSGTFGFSDFQQT